MLLWLAQNFQQDFSFLRVFNFITFRAVFATLTALLIVMLAAKPYSASRETRGTATMLIRKTLMGRERTGRLTAIAPHTRERREARREAPVRPPAKYTSQTLARHPHPAAAGTPRRDQTMFFN